MMSSNASSNGAEVVVRDLDLLLRKRLGDQVEVVNLTTLPLLQKGENYGSCMIKLDVVIKMTKSSTEEKLQLVAKTIPTAEFQKSHLNITSIFAKEIFVYETLVPAFKQLESETAVEETDAIDIFPKYYGGRLSRNCEDIEQADEDAIILLENLKIQGFDIINRKLGVGLDHVKLALIKLAHFHALGFIARERKPSLYVEFMKRQNIFPMHLSQDEFNEIIEHTIETVCKDPRIAKYENRIRATVESRKEWAKYMNMESFEPWITIIHGDCWINNVMFKGLDKAEAIKFIDFQISEISSPLRDVCYFISYSVSPEIILNYLDELLNLYYQTLIENLKKFKCNTILTRESFDHEVKRVMNYFCFFYIWGLKFVTLEVTKDTDFNDIKSSVMLNNGNQLYIERVWTLVFKFVEKGWI